MKKILHLLVFSLLAFNAWAYETNTNIKNYSPELLCGVTVSLQNTPGGGVVLAANATGTAPFTYLWSNGQTTQYISPVASNVNYCVAVTDANGCAATACLSNSLPCAVSITNNPNAGMTAVATGAAPFTYLWSNGATTQSIIPSAPGNYCVNVADAAGCTATACYTWGNPVTCAVTITNTTNTGMTAMATGVAPFTYSWSNGATTQSIMPSAPGSYCVTVVDNANCVATTCLNWGNPNSCSVTLSSTATGAGWQINANTVGAGPYTYQWSNQNASTSSIMVNSPGTYCVTITSANGCLGSDCITVGNNNCVISIFEQATSIGTGLFVITTAVSANVSYQWSTGEVTPVIYPTSSGNYCVTVSGGGCTATACYDFVYLTGHTISGYVQLPNVNGLAGLSGTVELFHNSTMLPDWQSVGTVPIQPTPGGTNYYTFGQQLAPGQYIIKATLSATNPNASIYMPTYYVSTVHWDEATIVSLPTNGAVLFNIMMSDGQNLTSGPGEISGSVTEGDGFTSNGEGVRGDTPRPNTSVLLFDQNEQPITHTLTDDQGMYTFSGLPYGTFKLVVEIVGVEQVERWVTLSADNPLATGNDFKVTENGIVLGLNDLLAGNGLEIMPNPTSGNLNLRLDANNNFKASIRLTRLDGTTVLVNNQQVVKGSQVIKLDLSNLSSGLYILHLNTGSEVISAKVMKQ